MPAPTYAQNKEHIYKWRENHYDEFRKKQNIHQLKYQKRRAAWKKIQKEFLLILII